MEAKIRRISEDILYAGTDPNIVQRINERYPTTPLRQIGNYKELESYLINLMMIFESSRDCGVSGYKFMKGIYPRVMLIVPDLPESRGSEKLLSVGPGIVDAAKSGLRYIEAYVLANDEAYETDRKGLKVFCEKGKIPVIKESELEQRLNELLK